MEKRVSKYPLLTIDNVTYWYWECDPAYSVNDIVKVTGAPETTVQRFMNHHNIPTRNRSEANINRFKCPHKKQSFVKQRNSPEFKNNLSKKAALLWTDTTRRNNIIKNLKKYNEGVLGAVQAQVLYILNNREGLFLTELVSVTNKNTRIVDHALKSLLNRGLVARKKQENCNTGNSYTSHYFYSITREGMALIVEKEKDQKFASLFNRLKLNIANQDRNSQLAYLGKNQKVILKLFEENHSLFLTDLKELTSMDSKTLDRSLRGLYTRGILSRKKETNPKSPNAIKCYNYKITDLGRKIVY